MWSDVELCWKIGPPLSAKVQSFKTTLQSFQRMSGMWGIECKLQEIISIEEFWRNCMWERDRGEERTEEGERHRLSTHAVDSFAASGDLAIDEHHVLATTIDSTWTPKKTNHQVISIALLKLCKHTSHQWSGGTLSMSEWKERLRNNTFDTTSSHTFASELAAASNTTGSPRGPGTPTIVSYQWGVRRRRRNVAAKTNDKSLK